MNNYFPVIILSLQAVHFYQKPVEIFYYNFLLQRQFLQIGILTSIFVVLRVIHEPHIREYFFTLSHIQCNFSNNFLPHSLFETCFENAAESVTSHNLRRSTWLLLISLSVIPSPFLLHSSSRARVQMNRKFQMEQPVRWQKWSRVIKQNGFFSSF